MTVAGLDEISNFLSGFSIDDAAKPRRSFAGRANHAAVVDDQANLNPANSCVPGNDFLCVIGLELVEVAAVENTVKHLACAVRLPVVFRKNFVQLFRGPSGVFGSGYGNRARSFQRQLRNELSDFRDALLIMADAIVGYA